MKPTATFGAVLIGILASAMILPAHAACPPPLPGDTAAEIRANSERLVCLQTELAARSEQHRLELQIDALNERLRSLELQRRFDALPPVPLIVAPPLVLL